MCTANYMHCAWHHACCLNSKPHDPNPTATASLCSKGVLCSSYSFSCDVCVLSARSRGSFRCRGAWLTSRAYALPLMLAALLCAALAYPSLLSMTRVNAYANPAGTRQGAPPQPARAAGSAAPPSQATAQQPKLFTYEVVRELPHDPRAFTQGLQFDRHNGKEVFWESTGMYGTSQVREVRCQPKLSFAAAHKAVALRQTGSTLIREGQRTAPVLA